MPRWLGHAVLPVESKPGWALWEPCAHVPRCVLIALVCWSRAHCAGADTGMGQGMHMVGAHQWPHTVPEEEAWAPHCCLASLPALCQLALPWHCRPTQPCLLPPSLSAPSWGQPHATAGAQGSPDTPQDRVQRGLGAAGPAQRLLCMLCKGSQFKVPNDRLPCVLCAGAGASTEAPRTPCQVEHPWGMHLDLSQPVRAAVRMEVKSADTCARFCRCWDAGAILGCRYHNRITIPVGGCRCCTGMQKSVPGRGYQCWDVSTIPGCRYLCWNTCTHIGVQVM